MSKERSQTQRAIGSALLIAAATAVYYAIPVPAHTHEDSWITLFSCGVVILGLLIVLAVARLLRAGEQARVRGLVLLLTLSVLFFSYADAAVAKLPGQFVSLTNKTDALYFNISTLATVGFGDVHAAGQLARVAVTLQIVFNLIFLGTAASVIASFFRNRARRYTGGSGSGGGAASGQSATGPSAGGPSAPGA